jgi:hypothetical protein
MRRSGSWLLALVVFALGSSARAAEPEPAASEPPTEDSASPGAPVPPTASAPPETPETPGPSTTVVAAPGGPGVTVVAPMAHGGTVVARDCGSVTVTGSPTLVDASGQPLCPFKPPKPEIRYVYVEVPVEVPGRERFAPDGARSGAIAFGAITLAVGSLLAGGWYADSVQHDYYQCGFGSCRATGGLGPLAVYTGIMSFAPTLPHFVVGDSTGGWIWSAAIASTIAIAKGLDIADDGNHGIGGSGVVLGFIIPTTMGIIALATTPHAEDLVPEKKKKKAKTAQVDGFAFVPVATATGHSNGGLMSVSGRF